VYERYNHNIHMFSKNAGIKYIKKPDVKPSNGFTPSTSLRGFTIIELILVIMIIGILAAISIVSYGNWQKSLIQAQLESNLNSAATAMEGYRNFNNGYPSLIPTTFTSSQYVTLSGGGSSDSKEYCIDAVSSQDPTAHYYIDQDIIKSAQAGTCASRPKKWKQISSGANDACAMTFDNKAYCWGYNGYGRLGNNSIINSSIPIQVDITGILSGKTFKYIKAGYQQTCAVASDDNAYCWGYNNFGQLGNNSTTQSLTPIAVDTSGVLSGKTVGLISLGNNHTCVIASDGKAYCWGLNSTAQLGNNSTTQSLIPVAVNMSGVLNGKTVKSISTGAFNTCVIASDDKAYCWGNGLGTVTLQSGVPVAVDTSGVLSGKTIKTISNGSTHTCASTYDKKAYCWGSNSYGQLGNGLTTSSSVPVSVDMAGLLNGKSIESISAGWNNTCVTTSDGKAYCWGENDFGQLGNNSTTQSLTPIAVDMSGVLNGKTVESISTGGFTTCATTSDNKAYCWGLNSQGQIGNNYLTNSQVPALVSEP